ncbi:MAG: SMC-Scp complex subunit ScpB [Candidatus Ancaeobacter aquaticus]|nr:SMC-Scp complex subunit ScpB [Candidatus Ancaeobacter aquaticus]
MSEHTLKSIVEALLFVTDRPLTLKEIRDIVQDTANVDSGDIRAVIDELSKEYRESKRSYQIIEIANAFQFRTLPEFAPWLSKLFRQESKSKLSQPALETLAIISYKQPITRIEIESIRGVNIDGIMKTLLEKDLIKIVGKKDVPGHPFLFGTTKTFLSHFGLKDLDELPQMSEFKEMIKAEKEQVVDDVKGWAK